MEKEILYRFFSGESTVDEEKQLLDWLDADPANQTQLFAERRIFDAMLMHAQPPEARKSKNFVLPRWTREAIRYAAVVILALGVGGGYVSYRDQQLLQALNTISVPAGQRVDVTLPDGTKVCMNALSELKYPTFFTGKNRRVELSGEAFFDVAHDQSHPFIVHTSHCQVEVLGTKFNVEARPASDELAVSLVEGRVVVSDNANRNHSVSMSPQQRVAFRNNRFVVGQIPEGENFLWRDGLIGFRNASFAELLSTFEKYYGLDIELSNSKMPQTAFTGKIRISEGIDHALWVLQQSADFTYVRDEAKGIIYIK